MDWRGFASLLTLLGLVLPQVALAQYEGQPELPAGAREVVPANNRFATELYAQLRGGDDNIFFSPFSIHAALAGAYEGAKGDTAHEMERVLHFPQTTQLRAGMRMLREQLAPGLRNYDFQMSSGLWTSADSHFLPDYLDVLTEDYSVHAANLDFSADPELGRGQINAWVARHTQQRIPELFRPGTIGSDTKLVLANAVYFKAGWWHDFSSSGTEDQPFTTPHGPITVPLMFGSGEGQYMESAELQAVKLPYDDCDLAMLVILPRGDLHSVEAQLSPDSLRAVSDAMEWEEWVQVYLPRFMLHTDYSLPATLSAMGMPTAFNKTADFSGMTGSRDLMLGAAVHQAYIDVDEKGTEAAAATGIVAVPTSAPRMPDAKPLVFRADHPFLFAILDQRSGLIVFLGRVNDPSAS